MDAEQIRYVCDVVVTTQAPKNYKPRSISYNCIGFASKKSDSETIKEKAINEIKEALEENNPSVEFKFSAKVTTKKLHLYVM